MLDERLNLDLIEKKSKPELKCCTMLLFIGISFSQKQDNQIYKIRLWRHLRLKSAREGESLGIKVISASDWEIKGNRHSILGRSFAPASLITSEWL